MVGSISRVNTPVTRRSRSNGGKDDRLSVRHSPRYDRWLLREPRLERSDFHAPRPPDPFHSIIQPFYSAHEAIPLGISSAFPQQQQQNARNPLESCNEEPLYRGEAGRSQPGCAGGGGGRMGERRKSTVGILREGLASVSETSSLVRQGGIVGNPRRTPLIILAEIDFLLRG